MEERVTLEEVLGAAGIVARKDLVIGESSCFSAFARIAASSVRSVLAQMEVEMAFTESVFELFGSKDVGADEDVYRQGVMLLTAAGDADPTLLGDLCAGPDLDPSVLAVLCAMTSTALAAAHRRGAPSPSAALARVAADLSH